MSKFWRLILETLNDSIESVSIVNNGGNPQIVVTPKGAAKNIIDAVNKENGEKEATQEGKQESRQEERKASSKATRWSSCKESNT